MGPREILIILLIVLLLFGAPKLPQLARSLGQSMRILKDETKTLTDDPKSDQPAATDAPASSGTSDTRPPAETDTPASSSSDEPRDNQK
ncbi:Sec-independent protein translocase subunit TatA [Demequina sp.]|uniref:Sec-independent protein translocase subunit TatA n=1 Tax=Demequina sp. TaxID=2050685 RepID=UPI0025FB8765|nr:Sec-independent protein translocase subunit TatA [Demequina sp.]